MLDEFGIKLLLGTALSFCIWMLHLKLKNPPAGTDGVFKLLGKDAFVLLIFIQLIRFFTAYYDFSVFLLMISIFSGICIVLRNVLLKKGAISPTGETEGFLRYWGKDGFVIIFGIFVLRAFIGEPYRIPTGSMKPNLLEGDFIIVSKVHYGFHFPLVEKELMQFGDVKVGDVIVFRYPVDPHIDYIKRVVAVGGDEVEYKMNELYVNGKKVDKKYIGIGTDSNLGSATWPVTRYKEQIGEKTVEVYNQNPTGRLSQEKIRVPEDQVFVMGDNRDNSIDSRKWGFVHRNIIQGKAVRILFSWDPVNNVLRSDRFGKGL